MYKLVGGNAASLFGTLSYYKMRIFFLFMCQYAYFEVVVIEVFNYIFIVKLFTWNFSHVMLSTSVATALYSNAEPVRNLTIHFISKLGYEYSLSVIRLDYFRPTAPLTCLQVMRILSQTFLLCIWYLQIRDSRRLCNSELIKISQVLVS